MGYLGATLTQVFTRERGADVSLRDVTIARRGNENRECEWCHAPEAHTENLGNFEKSQFSRELDSEREGSTFAARWGQTNLCATGAARMGGGDGKASIERSRISLPYVEKPLNSRVIKSFVLELRGRKCFCV